MDKKICERCGAEIPDGMGMECVVCKDPSERKKSGRRWYLAAGLTLILLLAVGLLIGRAHEAGWDLSWDALTGKPVAVINGDPVTRPEFRERLAISRTMLERQYGKGLFAGEEGEALLANLERDVLEKLLVDQLVAQEARRLVVLVSDEQVRQELEVIGREIYGSREKFQAALRDDGIPEEYLFDHIRNLMLRREVAKAKALDGSNADESFGIWLVQARQNAGVTVYRTGGSSPSPSRGGSSCCGSGGVAPSGGGGGCGGSETPADAVDPELKKEASAAVLAEYRKANPDGQGVETRVTDFGCHVQVDIVQEGKILKSYSYQNGKPFES